MPTSTGITCPHRPESARGVMLKFGRDELCRRLWRVVPSDPRLRIVLKLLQRHANAFPMCVPHPIIAPDKGSERNGFRRGKGSIPSGAVLHRLDGLSVGVLVLVGRSLPDQLFSCFRVLALAEPCKILGRNRTGETESGGELALPLAPDFTFLRPVILLLRREFLRVIGLRLAGGKWF